MRSSKFEVLRAVIIEVRVTLVMSGNREAKTRLGNGTHMVTKVNRSVQGFAHLLGEALAFGPRVVSLESSGQIRPEDERDCLEEMCDFRIERTFGDAGAGFGVDLLDKLVKP